MKTLQEIKNDVARKHNFVDWLHLLRIVDFNDEINNSVANELVDEIAEACTSQLKDKNKELLDQISELKYKIDDLTIESGATRT